MGLIDRLKKLKQQQGYINKELDSSLENAIKTKRNNNFRLNKLEKEISKIENSK